MGNVGLVSDTFFSEVILKPIIFDIYSKCVLLASGFTLGVQDPYMRELLLCLLMEVFTAQGFPHTYPRNMTWYGD